MSGESSEPLAAVSAVMSLDEFHRLTGGAYRLLSDDEVVAMIGALTVAAEIVCDCADRMEHERR